MKTVTIEIKNNPEFSTILASGSIWFHDAGANTVVSIFICQFFAKFGGKIASADLHLHRLNGESIRDGLTQSDFSVRNIKTGILAGETEIGVEFTEKTLIVTMPETWKVA